MKQIFKIDLVIKFFFVCNVLIWNSCQTNKELQNYKYKELVSSEIQLEKSIFKINESINAWFNITNISDEVLHINNSPLELFVNGKKIKNFDVKFIELKSTIEIIPINQHISIAGRYGVTKLIPGESIRISIHRSKNLKIDKPGSYKIVVTKSIYMKATKKWNRKGRIINFEQEAIKNFKINKL